MCEPSPPSEWCRICGEACRVHPPHSKAPDAAVAGRLQALLNELDAVAVWVENPRVAIADRTNPYRIAATLRGIVRAARAPDNTPCVAMAACPRCGRQVPRLPSGDVADHEPCESVRAALQEAPHALHDAAERLYRAGRWSAPTVSDADAAALWEALRDALGLSPGTATALGVDGRAAPPRAPHAPLPTAGDLLIRAVDRAMQHGMSCVLEDCGTCDAGFNQIRLAYKVWTNSAHQHARPVVIESEPIAIESRWRDKDARFQRAVTVVALQGDKVAYRNTDTGRLAVSRRSRFLDAFAPDPVGEEAPHAHPETPKG
jgi:hypothetical protein